MRGQLVHRLVSGALLFLCLLYPALASTEVSVPQNPDHAWRAPLASQSLLVALDLVEEHVLVVGERGHILKAVAVDPVDWQQAAVETQVLLNAIHMHDGQRGWAVGHDAVILSTQDGGASWQKQFEAAQKEQPLFDVWFRDANNGIAIGAYGYYLTTSDAGRSWQSSLVNEDHDYHLNAITSNEKGDLYIAAESGYVYRLTDQGESWEVLKPPYEGSFFDILAFGDTVVVVGLRGHAYISRDKGDNWQRLSTDTQTSLTAVNRLQNGQLIIVGHAGVVLLSDDEMKSTSLYRLSERSAISDAVESRANQLVMVCDHGVRMLDLCHVLGDKLSGGCE